LANSPELEKVIDRMSQIKSQPLSRSESIRLEVVEGSYETNGNGRINQTKTFLI